MLSPCGMRGTRQTSRTTITYIFECCRHFPRMARRGRPDTDTQFPPGAKMVLDFFEQDREKTRAYSEVLAYVRRHPDSAYDGSDSAKARTDSMTRRGLQWLVRHRVLVGGQGDPYRLRAVYLRSGLHDLFIAQQQLDKARKEAERNNIVRYSFVDADKHASHLFAAGIRKVPLPRERDRASENLHDIMRSWLALQPSGIEQVLIVAWMKRS